jgi:amino acid adenylation domain-containing protein
MSEAMSIQTRAWQAWDDSSCDHRESQLLHRRVERHALTAPAKTAVSFGSTSWSYAALVEQARHLACGLQAKGVGRGSRVVVCVHPCLELPAALLAIQMAAAVYIPLDPTYPEARLAAIAAELCPALILADRKAAPLFAGTGMAIEDLAGLCRQPANDVRPAPVDSDPEDPAYIFYTSGTTGAPKGIVISRRGFAFYVNAAIGAYDIGPDDVMPAIAKFSFSISLFELMSPLVAGGALVILERDHIMKPALLAETLEKITVVHMGPSLFGRTLDHIQSYDDGVRRFDHVRHASVGGDVAQPDLLERLKAVFPKAEIYVIYGCSEIACMGCTYPVPRDRQVERTYVGKAYDGAEVRLWQDDGGEVQLGATGEVLFAGPGLLNEYVGKPALTAEKHLEIDGKRYFRTGDLGRLDRDGNLELLGRRDFQIKLRGMRIEPAEIEVQLRQTDGIREAIVAAVETEELSKRLVAYVVPEDGAVLEPSAIRSFLAARLPDYMIPAAFMPLERLPLNPNLKVDRKALPPVTRERLITIGSVIAPRNEIERRLAEIWCAELGQESVGITQNFFDLGGDSLSATNVLMDIEAVWGKTLSTDVFLQQPTIETLARVIAGEDEADERGDLVTLRAGSVEPPIFCLFGILTYRDLAAHLGVDRSIVCVAPKIEDELFFHGDVEQIRALFASFEEVAERYLAIIRAHRPRGPYILAGHSWGGVVALEAARRLRGEGETVELVVLFDCNEPQFFKRTCQPSRVGRVMKALVDKTRAYLSQIMPRAAGEGRLDRRKYNGESWRWEVRWDSTVGYAPEPYDGPVVLFKANDRSSLSVHDPKLGWGALLPTLDVQVVPGNHYSLLRAPNVKVIAGHLECLLASPEG